eukprot:s1726_g14.t1
MIDSDGCRSQNLFCSHSDCLNVIRASAFWLSVFSSRHSIPKHDAMVKTSLFTFWALVVLTPLAAASPSHGSHDEAPAQQAAQPASGAWFLKIRHALSSLGVTSAKPGGSDCYYIMGLSKFSWAFICDLLALAVILLCIPLLLSCSKRRPLGASMFEFKCCAAPDASTSFKTPFSTYHSFQMN